MVHHVGPLSGLGHIPAWPTPPRPREGSRPASTPGDRVGWQDSHRRKKVKRAHTKPRLKTESRSALRNNLPRSFTDACGSLAPPTAAGTCPPLARAIGRLGPLVRARNFAFVRSRCSSHRTIFLLLGAGPRAHTVAADGWFDCKSRAVLLSDVRTSVSAPVRSAAAPTISSHTITDCSGAAPAPAPGLPQRRLPGCCVRMMSVSSSTTRAGSCTRESTTGHSSTHSMRPTGITGSITSTNIPIVRFRLMRSARL